jgi:hypothetical protein
VAKADPPTTDVSPDPEADLAELRFAELADKPDRTPEEQKELSLLFSRLARLVLSRASDPDLAREQADAVLPSSTPADLRQVFRDGLTTQAFQAASDESSVPAQRLPTRSRCSTASLC